MALAPYLNSWTDTNSTQCGIGKCNFFDIGHSKKKSQAGIIYMKRALGIEPKHFLEIWICPGCVDRYIARLPVFVDFPSPQLTLVVPGTSSAVKSNERGETTVKRAVGVEHIYMSLGLPGKFNVHYTRFLINPSAKFISPSLIIKVSENSFCTV